MSAERENITSAMDSSSRNTNVPEEYTDKLTAKNNPQGDNAVSQSSGSSGEDVNQYASNYLTFVETHEGTQTQEETTSVPAFQPAPASSLSSDALVE